MLVLHNDAIPQNLFASFFPLKWKLCAPEHQDPGAVPGAWGFSLLPPP